MKYTYIHFSQKNDCLLEHCLSFHLPILDISTQSFLPLNLTNVSQVRVRALSFPIITHTIKWFSLTVKEGTRLFKNFDRNNFIVDMNTLVADRIYNLASNIFKSDNVILNDCYYALGHNIFYQERDLTGFSRVSFQ